MVSIQKEWQPTKKLSWEDRGRRRGTRRTGSLRESTDTCTEWFLNELWRMAWESSRMDVDEQLGVHSVQVRGDVVLDENGDNREKWSDLIDIYGIELPELVPDWNKVPVTPSRETWPWLGD